MVMSDGFCFAVDCDRCIRTALIGPHAGATILGLSVPVLQRKVFDAFELCDEFGNFFNGNCGLYGFRCRRFRIKSADKRVSEPLKYLLFRRN